MSEKAKRPVYPGLDSLRGFAALAVLATHTAFWAGQYGDGLWGAISPRLDIGVAVFFVLSGFLLTEPYFAAMSDGRELPGTRRYLWKRALRILPLYWITVIIAMTTLSDNQGASIGRWISNLTLTDLYQRTLFSAGLTHMWSLSTEVAFYLALPLLMLGASVLACKRGWNPGAILWLLVGVAVVNMAWLTVVDHLPDSANLWLPAFGTWFGAGMAIAVLRVDLRREDRRRLSDSVEVLARHPGICWTIALSAFALATTPLGGPSNPFDMTTAQSAITKNLLYAVFAALAVLPSTTTQRSRYARGMAWRPFRHLGLVSYGVFCLHLVILHGVAHWRGIEVFSGNGIELFVLTAVASIAAAELSYRCIEKPSNRLRNLGARSQTDTTSTPRAANTPH